MCCDADRRGILSEPEAFTALSAFRATVIMTYNNEAYGIVFDITYRYVLRSTHCHARAASAPQRD